MSFGERGGSARSIFPTEHKLLRGAAVLGKGAKESHHGEDEQPGTAGNHHENAAADGQAEQDENQSCQRKIHCPLK